MYTNKLCIYMYTHNASQTIAFAIIPPQNPKITAEMPTFSHLWNINSYKINK